MAKPSNLDTGARAQAAYLADLYKRASVAGATGDESQRLLDAASRALVGMEAAEADYRHYRTLLDSVAGA